MHSSLILTRKSIPAGLLAREILKREARDRHNYLWSKGIRDPKVDEFLRQELAPTYGDGNLTATSSSASTRVTSSKTVPANAVVLGFMKWEDDTRTPTLSGWGVSSWTYPQHINTGGPRLRVGVGVSSGTTGTLTADWGSATGWVKLGAVWFNGCDTVTPVDTSGQGTGSSATPAVSALTNSVADSVYVLGTSLYGDSGHSAWSFGGTGGTEALDASSSSGVGYLIVASAASRNGQCTVGSVDWAAALVIIKGGSSSITGNLSATVPAFTISMAGAVDLSAQWAATFGGFGGSRLTGTLALQAELNAQLPAWTTALTAGAPNLTAELQAQLNAFVVNFVSDLEVQANLNAAINAVQAAFTSTAAIEAQLNALIPALTAALIEDTAMEGNLAAQLPGMLTQFTGAVAITGNLNAALAAFNAQFRESAGGGIVAGIVKRKLLLLLNEEEDE